MRPSFALAGTLLALLLAGTAHAQSAPQTVEALRAENERLRAELQRYQQGYAQLGQANQQLQAERDQARTASTEGEGALAACEAKNMRLVELGREILTLYERKGFREVLLQKEPVTGLKRVELENLAQGYGDKLYENKFDRRVDGLAAPTPAGPAAPAFSAEAAPANPDGATR